MLERVYDMPLVDWIQIGLNKDRLAQALEAIRNNEPLNKIFATNKTNREYINKILREEVVKQFSDYKRPVLEVELNAVDAKPRDKEEYNIYSKVRGSKFICDDDGESMDLEGILKLLIIPFSTEKSGLEEIGRFGVGFLSSFNYCIKEGAVVRIDTNDGDEGCTVYFTSDSPEIEGLRMLLKLKGKRSKGTKVRIYKNIENVKALKEYLANHLSGIPSFKANIFVNKEQVNKSDEKWYLENVELRAKNKKIIQPLGLKIYDYHSEGRNAKINLTSQGVLVKKYGTDHPGCVVAFPAAVQLVEGRDEFKIDDNYRRCKNAVFGALEKYIRENIPNEKDNEILRNKKSRIISGMDTLIPSLCSALEIKKLSKIPNIQEIKELLFPGKKYVVAHTFYSQLHPFLGETLEQNAVSMSSTGCSYWREFLKGNHQLKRELLKPLVAVQRQDIDRKFANKHKIPETLHHILNRLVPEDIYKVKFMNIAPTGEHIFFVANESEGGYHKDNLYINLSHPLLQGEFNPVLAYEICSRFYEEAFDKHSPLDRVDPETAESKIRANISKCAVPLKTFYNLKNDKKKTK